MSQDQMKQTIKNFFTKEVNYFLTFAFLGIVISYIIYFWFPQHLNLIIEEDNLIENLSALGFLTAGFLGIWAVKKNKKWKKLSMLVAFLGFLGFLDEISFGERIFDFNYPSIMGWQVDSAHDLFAVAYLFFESIFGYHGTIAIVVGSLIVALAIFLYQGKYTLNELSMNTLETVPGRYLVLFGLFLVVAILVDLKENTPPRMVIEEMFEFYAAILLCLYSISLPKETGKTKNINSGKAGSNNGSITKTKAQKKNPV